MVSLTPSPTQADLDSAGNAMAIQALVLQNEGWERDRSVPEPAEPGFSGEA